jgi:FKBP-type peptidyl-prolyl cis-trans isomerase 2
MFIVKVEDLDNLKVYLDKSEVPVQYAPVSYTAGYNQAIKDMKEAMLGLVIYDIDVNI